MDVINSSTQSVVFRAGAPTKKTSLSWRIKRCGDFAMALVLLGFLLPIMLLVVAAIRTSSRGPIIFGHQRVGHDGRIFTCLKFRTMYVDAVDRLDGLLSNDPAVAAEWALRRKLDRDPRVTPIGRWLRALSLDELPQLINVLRGDMSMVGPRPVTDDELLRYGVCARWYVSVYPGITGLWQVKGRSDLSYGERVELDRQYAEEWSLWQDIAIILRTPPAVFLRRGAQ